MTLLCISPVGSKSFDGTEGFGGDLCAERRNMLLESESGSSWWPRPILASSAIWRSLTSFTVQDTSEACPDEGPVFGCMQCRLSCKTLGGEGAHMYRTHGETHPVRTLMGNTQCGACLREYFTMGKLKAHLIRSDVCRTTWSGTL